MAGDTNNDRNVNGLTPTFESLKITSRNVDGLRDENKRKKLFLLLKASQDEIFLLQETHCTSDIEKTWTDDWDGPILFSHGTSRKRGVAILIKRSCNLTPTNTIKDDVGRFIITQLPMLDHNITLVNIYGPKEDSPNFFQNIISKINEIDTTEHIMGGDFNVTQTFEMDRFGSKNDYGKNSREILHIWMEENSMTDIWRLKNPNTRRYTLIRKKPYLHGSRIDYFLVSSSLIPNVKIVDIGVKFLSDHAPIYLDLFVPKTNRGKGYFKLNTSHLKNPDYVTLINLTIDKTIREHENVLDPQQLWEYVKFKIRQESINFGARQKKNNIDEINFLENEMHNLQNDTSLSQTELDARIEVLKTRLDNLLLYKIKGIQVRARANQIELDEKSTKFFYKQENINNNKKKLKDFV